MKIHIYVSVTLKINETICNIQLFILYNNLSEIYLFKSLSQVSKSEKCEGRGSKININTRVR